MEFSERWGKFQRPHSFLFFLAAWQNCTLSWEMPLARLLACSLSTIAVASLRCCDASPIVDWAIRPALGKGPKAESNAMAIAPDGQGGAYIAGTFKGTYIFGEMRITSHGSTNDIFVGHMSRIGVVDWTVSAGGSGDDAAYSIASDGEGGALVVGYFSGNASFGATHLTSKGLVDAFVLHVNSTGGRTGANIDWAVSMGGVDVSSASDIAHDGEGGAYVAGYFSAGPAVFGATTLDADGIDTGFVAHVVRAGTLDWAAKVSLWIEPDPERLDNGLQGPNESHSTVTRAKAIVSDGAGGFYVAVDDRLKAVAIVLHMKMTPTLFICDWAVKIRLSEVRDIALNEAGGGVYVAGHRLESPRAQNSGAGFGRELPAGAKTLAFVSYVSEASHRGALAWTWVLSLQAGSSGYALAYDGSQDEEGGGGVWLTGSQVGGSGVLAVHFNQDESRSLLLQKATHGVGNGVAFNGKGAAFVVGFFEGGNTTFGNTTLASGSGNREAFVMRIKLPERSNPSLGLTPDEYANYGLGRGPNEPRARALPPPPPGIFGDAPCQDDHSECGARAKAGDCTHNATFMHAHCREACDKCEGALPVPLNGFFSRHWAEAWMILLGVLAMASLCVRNVRLRKRLLSARASHERAEHDVRILTHRCGYSAEPPRSCPSLTSHEPGHGMQLGSPPVSLPPGPPSSTGSAGIQLPMQSAAEGHAMQQPTGERHPMQPPSADAGTDGGLMRPATPSSMCPLERTMSNAVMVDANTWPDDVDDGSVVCSTEDLLDELQRYAPPLEWGTPYGPAERFGDLPPLGLVSELMAEAGTKGSASSGSATSPLADDSESAAGSVASFACDAPEGNVPSLPLPVPVPVPVPAIPIQIAAPAKEKRPYKRSIDGMLWEGAEAAGWRRHATKHCAWVDPQGKYHESATAARRKWFATPEELEAIAKRDSASWAERNARWRAGHIRREELRQAKNQGQRSEMDGTPIAAGDHLPPLG